MENPREKDPSISFFDQTPEGAEYRAYCGHVDCDIEGMARDPETERLMADWDALGISNDEIIERLKAHYKSKA